MSIIKTTRDLFEEYEEISALCHNQNEHIFITNNGKKDLVILSVEEYERICALHSLHNAWMQVCVIYAKDVSLISTKPLRKLKKS